MFLSFVNVCLRLWFIVVVTVLFFCLCDVFFVWCVWCLFSGGVFLCVVLGFGVTDEFLHLNRHVTRL